ncbi:uncharacterized protein VP01_2890g3 [Puccinia sorghi]|uniref:Uncharacterized protein n=1 Tax=Puccinia sorghi TaxID=27349 RepID=A0A0L6V1N0_9BASI|nr:uncharacterized protein VP01_2890g3 [Puccinia sorghi]
MSPLSKPTHSYRRVSLAIALSLATVIFHTILCILLSYSILDIISPHSRINAGRYAEKNATNPANITMPLASNLTNSRPAANNTAPVVPTTSGANNSMPSSLTLENARANSPVPSTKAPPQGANPAAPATEPPPEAPPAEDDHPSA